MTAPGLDVGDTAPDFTAPLVSPEGGVEEVSLARYSR